MSVHLASQMTAFSLEILLRLASTGESFCQLEWNFPSYQFPNFTTRHVLVEEGMDDVCFSGGLNWAARIFNHFHPLQPTRLDLEEETLPPTESNSHQKTRQKLTDGRPCGDDTGSESQTPWLGAGSDEFPISTPFEVPGTPLSTPPFHLDDGKIASVLRDPLAPPHDTALDLPCSLLGLSQNTLDSPTASGPTNSEYSDDWRDQAGSPTSQMSLTTGTTRQSTPEWDYDTPCGNDLISQPSVKDQAQIDTLSQRRQEAESLYARNGDSSAILAVLDSAAQYSAAWFPSGFARF